jgi:predicted transcriptional regulator
MYQEHRPMSIREISKKSDISWITVKKYIPKLLGKGIIQKIVDRKRKYYKFNYDKV